MLRRLICLLWIFCLEAEAAEQPQLWGYGVQGCEHFLETWQANENADAEGVLEMRRFEDWLTGLVSGLSLATGEDVLRGADIPTALRRIHFHCKSHQEDDFFNASMEMIRVLSLVR